MDAPERIVRIAARPLLRKLVTPLEADDLYQVGRVALWQNGQGEPEAMQMVIARNAMIEELRRHRWTSRGDYGDGAAWEMASYDGWASVPEGSTDCHAASIVAVRQCIARMRRLTERQRQVLCCLVAGMEKQEVAAACGVSPSRITQIVAELRERVERDLI
jgi:RNA polymerase sigma factor (sigma-70 family)